MPNPTIKVGKPPQMAKYCEILKHFLVGKYKAKSKRKLLYNAACNALHGVLIAFMCNEPKQ
jgi:hypothetical protein